MATKISIRGLAPTTKLSVSKAGLSYNPSSNTAQDNAQSWATVQAQISAGNNTYAGLQAYLKKAHNHAPVVGWFVATGKLNAK